MKNIVCVLACSIIKVSSAMASNSNILVYIQPILSTYENMGVDNNSVYTRSVLGKKPTWSSDVIKEISHSQEKLIFQALKPFEVLAVLKECVFTTTGAYNDHISKKHSEMLSEIFLSTVKNKISITTNLAFYKVAGVQHDVAGPACGLGLIGSTQTDNEFILLTSEWTD